MAANAKQKQIDMSNMINPLFIDDYIDECMNESVQGCFVGTDYWDAERQADKALEREREFFRYVRSLNETLHNTEIELARCKPEHKHKRKRIEDRINDIKEKLARCQKYLQSKHLQV